MPTVDITKTRLLNRYIRAYRLLQELQVNNIRADDIVPIMEQTLNLLTALTEEILDDEAKGEI